jgi:hypothetical protein
MPQTTERCAIARLASLVDDMVVRLEASVEDGTAMALVPECNAALEDCLEVLRDAGDRDSQVRAARTDLRRLSRLLKLVGGPDVPFVLRQILRVLDRIDRCGDPVLQRRDRRD